MLFAFLFILSVRLSGQIHPNKLLDSLFSRAEYYATNYIDSCRILSNQLMAYAEQHDDVDGMVLGYYGLSSYHDRMGDYATASQLAYNGLQLMENRHKTNVNLQFKLILQLSICHRLIGQPLICKEYLNEGLSMVDKYDLKGADVDKLYVFFANLFGDLNKPDSVIYFLNLVKDKIPTKYNTMILAPYNNARAIVSARKGDYVTAAKLMSQTIGFCEQFNNLFFKTAAIQFISSYYLQSKIDSAIYFAGKAIEIATSNNYYRHINTSAQVLTSAYEKLGKQDSVIKYMKIQYRANEFLYGRDKVSQLLKLNAENKLKEKDSIIRFEKEKTKNSILVFGLMLGILMLGLSFLVYRNRQKSKIYQLLEDQNLKMTDKNHELEHTLTILKSTQAQLIHSEKMASLGELTAGIAHEIQNPLNFVNNFSELNNELVQDAQAELKKLINPEPAISIEPLQEILDDIKINSEKIHIHGNRASSIVKNMLEHSRVSTGEKSEVDLNVLCEEYIRLSYQGMRSKNKDFFADYKTYLDPDLPKIRVVAQDIARVLLNLCNNAFYAVDLQRKKSDESFKPLVTLATQRLDNKIQIMIRDNGPGIPDSIKDKIFQPFYTTKPTGEGTGLGLSLSYDIVKSHGGNISVMSTDDHRHSDSVGQSFAKGTEFIIELPI